MDHGFQRLFQYFTWKNVTAWAFFPPSDNKQEPRGPTAKIFEKFCRGTPSLCVKFIMPRVRISVSPSSFLSSFLPSFEILRFECARVLNLLNPQLTLFYTFMDIFGEQYCSRRWKIFTDRGISWFNIIYCTRKNVFNYSKVWGENFYIETKLENSIQAEIHASIF